MKSVALSLLALVLISGCAFTVDHEDVAYVPTAPTVAPVLGASAITVQVDTVDRRSGDPAQISTKKNGYGMEMAAIVSNRPIASLVQDAISEELRRRGFKVGPSSLVVAAEVIRFRSNFETGFFSADSRADVTIAVQVRNPAAAITYSRTIIGEARDTGIQIMTGKNAKASLEKALPDAIDRLMADPAFTRALLDSSGPVV